MDNNNQNATFTGDVRAKTPRPVTIETDRLDWNSARRVISTASPVRVWASSAVLTGRDLFLNLDKQTLALSGGVTASLNK